MSRPYRSSFLLDGRNDGHGDVRGASPPSAPNQHHRADGARHSFDAQIYPFSLFFRDNRLETTLQRESVEKNLPALRLTIFGLLLLTSLWAVYELMDEENAATTNPLVQFAGCSGVLLGYLGLTWVRLGGNEGEDEEGENGENEGEGVSGEQGERNDGRGGEEKESVEDQTAGTNDVVKKLHSEDLPSGNKLASFLSGLKTRKNHSKTTSVGNRDRAGSIQSNCSKTSNWSSHTGVSDILARVLAGAAPHRRRSSSAVSVTSTTSSGTEQVKIARSSTSAETAIMERQRAVAAHGGRKRLPSLRRSSSVPALFQSGDGERGRGGPRAASGEETVGGVKPTAQQEGYAENGLASINEVASASRSSPGTGGKETIALPDYTRSSTSTMLSKTGHRPRNAHEATAASRHMDNLCIFWVRSIYRHLSTYSFTRDYRATQLIIGVIFALAKNGRDIFLEREAVLSTAVLPLFYYQWFGLR